jgi:hypothetical protein
VGKPISRPSNIRHDTSCYSSPIPRPSVPILCPLCPFRAHPCPSPRAHLVSPILAHLSPIVCILAHLCASLPICAHPWPSCPFRGHLWPSLPICAHPCPSGQVSHSSHQGHPLWFELTSSTSQSAHPLRDEHHPSHTSDPGLSHPSHTSDPVALSGQLGRTQPRPCRDPWAHTV